MGSDQEFALSVTFLNLILALGCARIRTASMEHLALMSLVLYFGLAALSWLLFVFRPEPVLHWASNIITAIYCFTLPVFAMARCRINVPWLAITFGCLSLCASYTYFQFADIYSGVLHSTALFGFVTFWFPGYLFLFRKSPRTASDILLSTMFFLGFTVLLSRSVVLIVAPGFLGGNYIASFVIWPGLFAGIGIFAVTGYMEEAQEKLKAQAEMLRDQAWRDPLTRLLNRRGFDEAAHGPLANAERTRCPTSLIVVDVDHFKAVNDTYGHDAGDAVLQALATTLKVTLRDGDVLARFGGEEFVILLPGMDLDEACACAERLRAAVALIDVHWKNTMLRLTASFGVAAQSGGGDLAPLFRETDAALYRAKANGRNRVETAEPTAAVRASGG